MPVENLYQQLQTFRRGKRDVVTWKPYNIDKLVNVVTDPIPFKKT